MPERDDQVEPDLGPVEWIDLDDVVTDVISTESPGPDGRRRLGAAQLVLGGGLTIAVVVAVLTGRGDDSTPPVASQASTSTATATPTSSATEPTASRALGPKPTTKQLHPNILGVRADWELFARGPSDLVRIELAAGRVTTTAVPPVPGSGPVSFIVTGDRAIIRPLDNAPSYVVADGSSARQLTGQLGQATAILPGPDSVHVWRQLGSSPGTVTLATMNGTELGPSFSSPATAMSPLEPDGAGYFYFIGVGGAYDVRAGVLNRVTSGFPVAVGAKRWVAVECDGAYHCSTVAIDVATGVRRVIGRPRLLDVPIGSAAPDGSVAAAYELRSDGRFSLQLLDLTTGHSLTVPIHVSADVSDDSVVWAPDSSRLFVADTDGRVQVVDPATGRARPIDLALPFLTQLAIRGAG